MYRIGQRAADDLTEAPALETRSCGAVKSALMGSKAHLVVLLCPSKLLIVVVAVPFACPFAYPFACPLACPFASPLDCARDDSSSFTTSRVGAGVWRLLVVSRPRAVVVAEDIPVARIAVCAGRLFVLRLLGVSTGFGFSDAL